MPTDLKTATSPIVATGRLKLHATLPATPLLAASYDIDLGEQQFTIKAGGDLKEMWAASGGTVGKYKKRRVKPTLAYDCDLPFLPPTMLGYYLGTGAAGGAPNPGKVLEFYGWFGMNMEDEAVFNDLGLWVHSGFLCAVTVDGDFDAKGEEFANVKFSADVLLGRVKGTTSLSVRPVPQV